MWFFFLWKMQQCIQSKEVDNQCTIVPWTLCKSYIIRNKVASISIFNSWMDHSLQFIFGWMNYSLQLDELCFWFDEWRVVDAFNLYFLLVELFWVCSWLVEWRILQWMGFDYILAVNELLLQLLYFWIYELLKIRCH